MAAPRFRLSWRSCVPLVLALGSPACATLASSPSWTGGGLSMATSMRQREEDEDLATELRRIAGQPVRVGAQHILVMHADSERRPEAVKRSREEAQKRAQECLVKIRAGADFDEMVAQCSDEPGAAERGGDLGVFDRESMVKSFSDVAFSLRKGEVSEIVETPYGFHIIKRTE
jgi:parvulin-like peptidyl-prolyl isomerase